MQKNIKETKLQLGTDFSFSVDAVKDKILINPIFTLFSLGSTILGNTI